MRTTFWATLTATLSVGAYAVAQSRSDVYRSYAEMAAAPAVSNRATAVTSGPQAHWFGYYDKDQLDASGRYLLSLRTSFEHRLPKPGEAAEIGMIDLQDGNRWLALGESRLLVSLADLAKVPYAKQTPQDKRYVNHLEWSPDGRRFLLYDRWAGAGGMPTRVFTLGADGQDLRLLSASDASHYIWRDPEHALIWANGAYRLYKDDGSGEPKATLWQAPNGHQSYVPGTQNAWLVTDTYDRRLYLVHLPTGSFVPLGHFPQDKAYAGEWRCDLHPRVSRDGRWVFFDSPHAGNGRQLYRVDIAEIVRQRPAPSEAATPWWHEVFSLAFDGHGNFVTPHLGTLNATVASLGAAGFHGVWDADLNRDMPWMRGHEKAFAQHPGIKRLVYIEGAGASKVLARVSADGRVLFTENVLDGIGDPQRRRYVENLIQPDGRTVWFGDWQFLQGHALKTPLGQPLPTARDLGLLPFAQPLTGAALTDETEFWRSRSSQPLLGASSEGVSRYRAIPDDLTAKLDLARVTTQDKDGKWLVQAGESMLYDAPFATYQAAKARRAMETLALDILHYDDWDLRSPTLMNAKADIHVAAFRRYVTSQLSEEQCRAIFGVEKARIAEFDVLHYLLHPSWRAEYDGQGTTADGPAWMAACDKRWLSDSVWRVFQIACIEDRLASMKEIYLLNKAAARSLGRDVPMVANIIPTLSATFLQRDCVGMANFEWPCFKTYGAFPNPFGDYPQARLGLGPRMAAKIGVTGHAMVDPYVKPEHSGWDGNGFTRRHGETLHKVIAFDLLANRGIPAFALAWDGAYAPGSIHSAGQIHAFINETAPVLSRREFVADIGLAASSWSAIAAQTPFGGWNHEVSKRHLAEFVGWAQHLMTARDFPQWDVLPFDDVRAADLYRFKLVILPSVLVITADQLAALEAYLAQGGRLLITGETGTFTGPRMLLQPRPQSLFAALAGQYPQQVVLTSDKPGLRQHLDPTQSADATNWRQKAFREKPALTVTRAPPHLTVQLNESRPRPGEFTLDLVNHHHDLASDTLTAVTVTDFEIHLHLLGFKAAPQVEALRYDESAPRNTRRAPLPAANCTLANGILTLRIPPFTHYQILRITSPTP